MGTEARAASDLNLADELGVSLVFREAQESRGKRVAEFEDSVEVRAQRMSNDGHWRPGRRVRDAGVEAHLDRTITGPAPKDGFVPGVAGREAGLDSLNEETGQSRSSQEVMEPDRRFPTFDHQTKEGDEDEDEGDDEDSEDGVHGDFSWGRGLMNLGMNENINNNQSYAKINLLSRHLTGKAIYFIINPWSKNLLSQKKSQPSRGKNGCCWEGFFY